MEGLYLKNKEYFYSSKTNTIINREIESLYSKHTKKREVKVEYPDIDEYTIRNKVKELKQLVIETNQSCNMTCLYCSYASKRYLYQRPPTNKSISFNTCKQTIDYVYETIKYRNKREFTIGFYGGEPLLRFDLIKKIVNYSGKLFKGWKLDYIITTNGTLFTSEIIRYVVKNNFYILLSIDGPKENHDAKRIFHNGKGTHQIILKNLKLIKTFNEEYLKKNINFSAVFSLDLSFGKLFHFFRKNSLVKQNPVRLGFVNEYDTDYYDYYPYDSKKFKKIRNIIFESILKKKRKKIDLFPIEENMLIRHSVLSDSLNSVYFSGMKGACLYDSRLYVDTDGNFHICEKMNNKFPIGNYKEGYNYSRMTSIAAEYMELIKKNCLHCEVNFLCDCCFVHLAKNGVFEMDKKFCSDNKKAMAKMLEEHIYLKEQGLIE